jgi:flagellar hook-basal body complex protein FliE
MAAINPIAAVSGMDLLPQAANVASPSARGVHSMSFTQLVTSGLETVDAKVAKADALIQAYAIGDPVPVHRVGLAIEEARGAVEMASQIRSKLVDTYHDFLNMQL